jgi:hypothetical protein
MTRARSSSSARSSIAKLAVAGVLFGIPIVAVSIPAVAAAGGAPIVLPAPLPAEPPTNEPEPPPHHPAPPHHTYAETEDWWGYGMESGGGGGGG